MPVGGPRVWPTCANRPVASDVEPYRKAQTTGGSDARSGPPGDAHGRSPVSACATTRFRPCRQIAQCTLARWRGWGATPESEGLMRVRWRARLRTPASASWGRSRTSDSRRQGGLPPRPTLTGSSRKNHCCRLQAGDDAPLVAYIVEVLGALPGAPPSQGLSTDWAGLSLLRAAWIRAVCGHPST